MLERLKDDTLTLHDIYEDQLRVVDEAWNLYRKEMLEALNYESIPMTKARAELGCAVVKLLRLNELVIELKERAHGPRTPALAQHLLRVARERAIKRAPR